MSYDHIGIDDSGDGPWWFDAALLALVVAAVLFLLWTVA